DAAKNRPPRYRFSGDHHGSSDLLIWNGGLRTIPMMRDDQRWLLGAASRTIRRIAGASKYSTPRPRAYVMSFSATVVTNSWRPSVPVSFSAGTFGGGGGGADPRRFSSSHFPRNTGEVRVAYEVANRTLPCPRSPVRLLSLSVTRRK